MYYFFWISFILFDILGIVIIKRLNKKSKKYICNFFFIYFVILIGARPDTLPDYKTYKLIFDYIQIGHNYGFSLIGREAMTGVEYGFLYLTMGIKLISFGYYRIYLAIITCFSLFFSLYALKGILCNLELVKDKDDYMIYFLLESIYFSYFGMGYQGIAIRAAISLMFTLLAVYWLLEKKYLFMTSAVVLGFVIQRMSIITILVIITYCFAPKISNKKIYVVIIGVVSVIGGIIFISNLYSKILGMIMQLYNHIFSRIDYFSYIRDVEYSGTLDRKRVLILFIAMLIIYFARSKHIKLLNIVVAGIVIMMLTLNISGSTRIFDYFIVFYVPCLCSEFIQSKKVFLTVFLIFVIMLNYMVSFRVWEII